MGSLTRREFVAVGATGFSTLLAEKARAQAPTAGVMQTVPMRAYDPARSGVNNAETILTQANVSARGVRLIWSQNFEGDARGAESQPLIVRSVPMRDGTTRDIVIVSAMNNLVWCFDANSSDILWVAKLAVPVKGNPSIDAWNINDHWGVLSTGVIDPTARRWYGVAWTAPDGVPQNAHHALYALDITNGNLLTWVSLAGVTYQAPGGLPIQKFGAGMRKQRSSLLMVNGVVFFASGSVLETSKGASGWVIAYDPKLGAVTAAIALTSRGYGAGVWMGGSGISADSAGNLYVVTGNGSFDAITDWGESALKLKYTPPASGSSKGSLTVIDNWTPYTDAGRIGETPTQSTPTAARMPKMKMAGVSLPSNPEKAADPDENLPVNAAHMAADNRYASWSDEDLGSAPGALIEKYGYFLIAGKDSVGYLVNSKSMGGTKPADLANPAANYAKLKQPPFWYGTYDGAVPMTPTGLDIFPGNKTAHLHSASVVYESPVWGTMLFCGAENSNVRAWQVTSTAVRYLACSADVASPQATGAHGGMTGWFLSASSNGTNTGSGLLWALMPYGDANQTVTNGRLVCLDPENFATFPDGSKQLKILWDSQNWNIQFKFNKFAPPVISGGNIFVITYDARLLCFGLA